MEDEVVGQKEEQGDQREDEEGEVNGDVEAIRQTHNNEMTMQWMNECGPKLEPCVCTLECESL